MASEFSHVLEFSQAYNLLLYLAMTTKSFVDLLFSSAWTRLIPCPDSELGSAFRELKAAGDLQIISEPFYLSDV